jgi:hypothetical protein
MLEVVGRFARQVVPSVVATIIAALLISVLNYAFSQKIGTVKTNGIAALSGAPNATTDFAVTEPPRQLEKTALIESPKAQTQEPKPEPKPARPAAASRTVHEPADALEPARAARARTRPAGPSPHAEPAPIPAPVIVTGPPAAPFGTAMPPRSAPPIAQPEPAASDVPRPPADIPQASPSEFRSAQRNSLFGDIFDAIRPSAN